VLRRKSGLISNNCLKTKNKGQNREHELFNTRQIRVCGPDFAAAPTSRFAAKPKKKVVGRNLREVFADVRLQAFENDHDPVEILPVRQRFRSAEKKRARFGLRARQRLGEVRVCVRVHRGRGQRLATVVLLRANLQEVEAKLPNAATRFAAPGKIQEDRRAPRIQKI
jgi:hypothetical protein